MLNLFYPFSFSKSANPYKIETVGEQVLCDHVYLNHCYLNSNDKLVAVASDVTVVENRITFSLKEEFLNHVSSEAYAAAIEKSFANTSHSFLKDSLIKIESEPEMSKVTVVLRNIPMTINHLLSLPDFYLSDVPGFYKVDKIESGNATLVRNEKIPQDYYANSFKSVCLSHYPSLLSVLKSESNVGIYTDGLTLGNIDASLYKQLNIEKSKKEWVLQLGFNTKNVPLEQRQYLKEVVNKFKNLEVLSSTLSSWSDQILPADSKFFKNIEVEYSRSERFTKDYTLGISRATYDSNALVQRLAEFLNQESNLKITIIDKGSGLNLYSDFDIYLSTLGINSRAPSNYLTFLYNYDPLVAEYISKEDLNQLLLCSSQSEYQSKCIALENIILNNCCVIPILHTSGVSLLTKDLSVNGELNGDWGFRANAIVQN